MLVYVCVCVDGSSESHLIGGEKNQSFDRATRAQYVLYSKSLGPLKRVLIEQLAGNSEEDDGKTKHS